MERLTLARLHLAREQPAEALAALAALRAAAEAEGRRWSMIEILALQALALQAQGDSAAALDDLARALALAEPEGYVRIFLDEGQPMRALLAEYSAQMTERSPANTNLLAYAQRLLAAFAEEAAAPGLAQATAPAQPLSEPLSDRELEVLRLLHLGCSTPEVAQRLTIAVSTVRSHVKNIYGKLGAHRRLEALRRAAELGLLD
jgi:LuxR family maltose regulon positive regulatory protein